MAEVQVTDLCRTAGVHRTTFYKHFVTASDLAVTITAELFDRIDYRGAWANQSTVYRTWLTDLLHHVAEGRSVYGCLLKRGGDANVMQATGDKLVARAAHGIKFAAGDGRGLPMDPQAYALAIGFGSFGLVQAVLTDDTLDIPATVEAFLDAVPSSLGQLRSAS